MKLAPDLFSTAQLHSERAARPSGFHGGVRLGGYVESLVCRHPSFRISWIFPANEHSGFHQICPVHIHWRRMFQVGTEMHNMEAHFKFAVSDINDEERDNGVASYTSTENSLLDLKEKMKTLNYSQAWAGLDVWLQCIVASADLEGVFCEHTSLPNAGCLFLLNCKDCLPRLAMTSSISSRETQASI